MNHVAQCEPPWKTPASPTSIHPPCSQTPLFRWPRAIRPVSADARLPIRRVFSSRAKPLPRDDHHAFHGPMMSISGRGKIIRSPRARNFASRWMKFARKCHGRTSRKSGRWASASFSETIGMCEPGVTHPNFRGLTSAMHGSCAAVRPQNCRMTLPFVDAP